MHRVINSLGSICLRMNTIGNVLLKNENNWLEQIKPYARKIDEQSQCIKYDEIGVKVFFKIMQTYKVLLTLQA